ncbi:MAG TPA: aminotransferase class I/II-fold pyridoxal phosphate-dependent enzyme [Streptosporangiaceae bacterium]|nr:aminotransferase class I/II-fold pyridoxal phosphate-dependent enzyme [Streptosporangiaceae bacterium]
MTGPDPRAGRNPVTAPARPAGPLPAAGAHGGDGPAIAAWLGVSPDAILDLSASLNPVAPDPVPCVARHLTAIRRYPAAVCLASATQALAEAIGTDPDRLLLTNGGAEAIALVGSELGGCVTEPDFGLYPRGSGPRWRSNPHNPTGLLAGPSLGVAVWDEAFYPLATGQWTRGDPGAVVVGSLTKLLACPGLRLGYLLADPPLVARCRARQPAWSVNGLAASALPDLLDTVELPAWSAAVARLRDQLAGLLRRHGLQPRPSDACWLLVDAPDLRARLALHGVVVRDCSSFGMPGIVRIAVPDEAGLARLDQALGSPPV